MYYNMLTSSYRYTPFLLAVSLSMTILSSDVDVQNILQRCCLLGRNKAGDFLNCENTTSIPISNVPIEYQRMCLSTIEICCFQYHRVVSCENGKKAAKLKAICDRPQDKTTFEDIHTFKYCCESCKLGILAASTSSCKVKPFQIDDLWYDAFSSCCNLFTTATLNINYCTLLRGELCQHICVPIPGSFRCQCETGYSLMTDGKSCQKDASENRCTEVNYCQHNCSDNGTTVLCSCKKGYELQNDNKSCTEKVEQQCPGGFRYDVNKLTCVDIDECLEGLHLCKKGLEICQNVQGSFKCLIRNTTIESKNPANSLALRRRCILGFQFNDKTKKCDDINECENRQCSSFEICENTIGSYKCVCAAGFQRDRVIDVCVDVNECQTNFHDCDVNSQRCDNTIGSFHCVRTLHCGTGYTFNSASETCEDNDECALGTDDCKLSGPEYECRNTAGSFRCQKKRICESVNCVKTNRTECLRGYELNEKGACVDVNECNIGFTCPDGLNCINTVGSYRCVSSVQCGDGLKLVYATNKCDDIDECAQQPAVCDHTCVNMWGSFRCACKIGFQLNSDARSCIDINECEILKDRRLCAGSCVNIPGSYKCECPEGYRIGIDGISCQDIDECSVENKCTGPDDVCINIRGSYRCYTISCPPHYTRDQTRRNRCSRADYYCRGIYGSTDQCLKAATSYSHNFVTLSSNLTITPSNPVDLFNLHGPQSGYSGMQFTLKLMNIRTAAGLLKVTEDYFQLKKVERDPASVSVALQKTIVGPQDVELELKMLLYSNGDFVGFSVSKLFIYVSQYDF